MPNFELFHFLRPYWLLALVPLAVLLIKFARRRASAGSWTEVIDRRLLPHLIHEERQNNALWPVIIIALIGTLMIVALAGPVWQQLPQPVFRTQSALIVALDLSRSMDAQDIKPNRLARAKHKIIDILRQRKEGQTALIVYALDAFVVSPLTQDTNTIASLVNTLTTDLMPYQGSHIEKALLKATDLFKQAGTLNGSILLVTDGVDTSKRQVIESAVQQVVDEGHSVSVLGIGTKDGAPIVDQQGGFVKNDQGAIVISKLAVADLQDLAKAGDGRFQLLTADDSDINQLKLDYDADMLKNAYKSTNDTLKIQTDLWQEEGPWLILFLLPFVALIFRRGWLALVMIFILPVPGTGYAFDWTAMWARPDQQAERAFKQGQHEQAEQLFENKQWKAAAAYRAGHYDKVIEQLENTNSADALYNKANALVKTGKLQDAVQYYEQALSLAPDHADAKYNRDLVTQYLKNNNQNNDGADDQSADKTSEKNNQDQKAKDSGQGDGQSDQEKAGNTSKGEQQAQAQNKQQNEQQNDAQNNNSTTRDSESAQQSNGSTREDGEPQSQDAADKEPAENKAQAESKQTEARDNPKKNNKDAPSPVSNNDDQLKADQQQVVTDQWLRRIPDDPGGLLRRKFQYQSNLNRNSSPTEANPW